MSPQPPVSFYTPRHVRLVRGIERCMKCEKPLFRTTLQAGRMFQTCEHKRCDFEWFCVALPPDAFGGYLAATLGEASAANLIRRLWPEAIGLPDSDLWLKALNEGEETAWIQVAVRPRERHLYRQSPLRDLLRAFSLV